MFSNVSCTVSCRAFDAPLRFFRGQDSKCIDRRELNRVVMPTSEHRFSFEDRAESWDGAFVSESAEDFDEFAARTGSIRT